jgi:hypothetical protein
VELGKGDAEVAPRRHELLDRVLLLLEVSLLEQKIDTAGSEADQAVDRLDRLRELCMDNQLPTWFSYLMLGTHELGLGKGKLRVDGNQIFRFICIGD